MREANRDRDVPAGEYRVEVSRRGSTVVLDEPVTVGAEGASDLELNVNSDSPGVRR